MLHTVLVFPSAKSQKEGRKEEKTHKSSFFNKKSQPKTVEMKAQPPEICTRVRFLLVLRHRVSQHLTCAGRCQVDLNVSVGTGGVLRIDAMTCDKGLGLLFL